MTENAASDLREDAFTNISSITTNLPAPSQLNLAVLNASVQPTRVLAACLANVIMFRASFLHHNSRVQSDKEALPKHVQEMRKIRRRASATFCSILRLLPFLRLDSSLWAPPERLVPSFCIHAGWSSGSDD